MILGQINLSSEAGKIIHDTCLKSDVHTIVEIGTWNGMGSTRCIEQAIQKTTKQAISIESSEQKYIEAKNNLSNSRVNIIYGKITDQVLNLNDLEKEFFTDYPKHVKQKWLEEDITNMSKAPNVLNMLPEQIDFLILDGGEFTSYFEYYLLKNRSRYVFLDDTRMPTVKNYQARIDLINNHQIIVDRINDRNGFCLGKIL